MSPVHLRASPSGPRPSEPPPARAQSDATSEVRPVAPRVPPPEPEVVDPELAWLDAQLAAELDIGEEAPDTERQPTLVPPKR